ncbi:MAG: polyprenyl synthetase family protein [Thermoplasmata archaeon]
MTAPESESAKARLESLLTPYRDASNTQIQAIWTEFAAAHPESSFPSSKTMRLNARLFVAGKRYRYALAVAGYRLLTGERPSRGLERAATWLEWYHLYTLFLDDIMDEDVRRRTLPSAWSTNARLYRGRGADEPAVVFRTRRHRYGVSQAILDALRIRSLAEQAIEGAVDLHASVRLEMLSELTSVDLVLSDGQGLDIDFEQVSHVPEDAYVQMSEAKTARLYLGAAASAAIAARASSEDRLTLEAYARHFAIAFQDRDDLLGAGMVASRIGGSREGDIRQGKRTRLYVLALEQIPPKNRSAFVRAYGRGSRTTKKDIATVRDLLRRHVLPEMERRIEANLAAARKALDRLPSKDPDARALLEVLLDAQRARVR